jgi:hypothetical protein
MKVRAEVIIELEAPDLDGVSDRIHQVWGAGDPADATNACIVLEDVKEVEWFSWEKVA